MEMGDDCLKVISNLWKDIQTWERLLLIIDWEGADLCNSGRLYLAVV